MSENVSLGRQAVTTMILTPTNADIANCTPRELIWNAYNRPSYQNAATAQRLAEMLEEALDDIEDWGRSTDERNAVDQGRIEELEDELESAEESLRDAEESLRDAEEECVLLSGRLEEADSLISELRAELAALKGGK